MKVKFILEKGSLDCDNTILNVDGIKLNKDEYPIFGNTSFKDKPISLGKVFKEDGVLKCETDLPDDYLNNYPNIGYQVIKSEPNNFGGVNILESKLVYVGVSINKNLDNSLKNISEQIKYL